MKIIYPGSFDPLTNGHMDMIKRLSIHFDHVIVAVIRNENKNSLFSLKEREEIIREAIKEEKLVNVSIKSFDGLLVNFAKKKMLNL